MESLPLHRILSMTALQKLSIKTLRKRGTPLFFMDMKSKRKAFVIIDIGTYELLNGSPGGWEADLGASRRRQSRGKSSQATDYRKMGLLWDRPQMTPRRFEAALRNPRDKNHAWAAKRFLEYAPSSAVTKTFSLNELRRMLRCVKLRPVYQEAWNHAVRYWSENP